MSPCRSAEAFAHLHVRSGFSYGYGVAYPRELAARAASVGMGALALTDRDTLAGVPRFLAACREEEVSPVVGTEISMEIGGEPAGHLVLLADSMAGYRSLCKVTWNIEHNLHKTVADARLGPQDLHMGESVWRKWPRVARTRRARAWLKFKMDLGKAEDTVEAYGRALERYLAFCEGSGADPETASRAHLAVYVRHLLSGPGARSGRLSNATVQLHLTAIRSFYDHLVEDGVREDNPVGRGRYTPGNRFGGQRGLVPRYRKLPWVPSEDEWSAVLGVAREETLRNRLMLAFSYDAALRREELCSLKIGDIDPSHQTLRIRAETTKGGSERVLPYSAPAGELYGAYLAERRELSREAGPVFLSESRRNRGKPVTIWTWSKVVRRIALRSGVERLSTHTMRHLCLTDLARDGWDIHEIARFAGHKNTDTTLQYIHLSARDLAEKIERGMAQMHAWRVSCLTEGNTE